MKTKYLSLSLLVAALASAWLPTAAQAQTTAQPPPMGSAALTNQIPNLIPNDFITSVKSYFTGFDTNSRTFANPVDLWTAENYRSGINSSAELGVSYDIQAGKVILAPEVVIRNAGIAGTIVSEQAGCGISFKYYDVKLTGYFDGGYSEFDSQGFFEVGLRAKKALTANTYAGVGIALQKLFGHSCAPNVNTTSLLPTVSAFLGATIPGW